MYIHLSGWGTAKAMSRVFPMFFKIRDLNSDQVSGSELCYRPRDSLDYYSCVSPLRDIECAAIIKIRKTSSPWHISNIIVVFGNIVKLKETRYSVEWVAVAKP